MHPKPNYDQPLKRLLLRAHDSFLALIAPGLKWRGELSPELPATARQADIVWDVEMAEGRRGTLHIELQTRPEEKIGLRIAGYALRLLERDDERPVRSVVVFLRPSDSIPASPYVMRWGGEDRITVVYDVIRLWEIPQEQILSTSSYELWPLAALMAGTTVESTQSIAERIAAAPLERAERSELIGLLAVLAGIRLPRDAILAVLRRNHMLDDLLKESSVASAWFEEGIEQGLQQGLQQGMRNTIRLVLEGRFGTLDEAVRAALDQADETFLADLSRHAGTDSLEQIRARLGMS